MPVTRLASHTRKLDTRRHPLAPDAHARTHAHSPCVCPQIDILDNPEADIASTFPACFAFIDQALAARAQALHTHAEPGAEPSREEACTLAQSGPGGVLVHCRMGVSRSASVCIAYLMRTLRISLARALQLLQEGRSVVGPNEGFLLQLRDLEETLHSQHSRT